MKLKAGIILGTGLETWEGERTEVITPCGPPSSPIVTSGNAMFLLRHGINHQFPPSRIPYKANLLALKQLGVGRVISVCSVGSLDRVINPGSFCVPEQLVDFTKGRDSSFSEIGKVMHISFWNPFSPILRELLGNILKSLGLPCHMGGTYIAVEGPAFSTQAESRMYRLLGGSIIGMTACPEAQLARELGLDYALLCCVTDYDGKASFEEIQEMSRKFQVYLTEIVGVFK